MKWKILTLLQLNFIIITHQSIAGITYHDDFDFEDRYRNVHECDPFYWHPLHLPEHCAEMFEKLIRSRVSAAFKAPVRVVKKKEKRRKYYEHLEPEFGYNYDDGYETRPLGYPRISYGADDLYGYDNFESQEDMSYMLTPYEEMLDLMRRDIMETPTAPVVGNSNFGPVAMYEQPISKKTEVLIKKISRMYAEAGRKQDDDDGYYYAKIEVPSKTEGGVNGDNPLQTIMKVLNNKTKQNKTGSNQSKSRKKKSKRQRHKGKGLTIE